MSMNVSNNVATDGAIKARAEEEMNTPGSPVFQKDMATAKECIVEN